MNQKIDWKLYHDNKLLVSRKNEEVVYTKEYLKYEKENEYNYVDLIKNIYNRKTDEYDMEIDFNEKTCSFNLEDVGNCKFDIKCNIKVKKKEITLMYQIDDGENKIFIEIKD